MTALSGRDATHYPLSLAVVPGDDDGLSLRLGYPRDALALEAEFAALARESPVHFLAIEANDAWLASLKPLQQRRSCRATLFLGQVVDAGRGASDKVGESDAEVDDADVVGRPQRLVDETGLMQQLPEAVLRVRVVVALLS